MATYVTTNPLGANNTQRLIMIQNFIMVENFDEIYNLLNGYTEVVADNLLRPPDGTQCISIWNKSAAWTPENVDNANNTEDAFTLYVKYGTLTNLNTMYYNDTNKFSIIGAIEGDNPCKLKKIFHALTRFTAQELNIDHEAVGDIGAIGPEAQKTLDNRIIFVRKSNIKDLFSNNTLDQAGADFNWEDSLKYSLKTNENICNISNFFRSFRSFYNDIPLSTAGDNPFRQSLGLGGDQTVVNDEKLPAFRDFINDTRSVGITDFDTIIRRIKAIRSSIDNKTSASTSDKDIITPYLGGYGRKRKQHWLGNISPDEKGTRRMYRMTSGITNPGVDQETFRYNLRTRYEPLFNLLGPLLSQYPVLRSIITVLALTTTNGRNPNPPPEEADPCTIVPVE